MAMTNRKSLARLPVRSLFRASMNFPALRPVTLKCKGDGTMTGIGYDTIYSDNAVGQFKIRMKANETMKVIKQ